MLVRCHQADVYALLVIGAGSDLFRIVSYPGLFYEFIHHNTWLSIYLVVNSQATLFHRRSSFRRRCLASCNLSVYHGQSGRSVTSLIRRGACLSIINDSPFVKAVAKSSTSPCVVCNMEETTISCLHLCSF